MRVLYISYAAFLKGANMNKYKLRRKLCWDNRGALEGLPLYLIILVVIAAVAIIVIFSYLTVLRAPELAKIDVYIDGEKADLNTVVTCSRSLTRSARRTIAC